MAKSLPPNPSLKHLRLEAKNVLKAHSSRLLQYLILLITPVKITHGYRLLKCVPFVNITAPVKGTTASMSRAVYRVRLAQ